MTHPPRPIPTITVGELRRALQGLPDAHEISFSGLTYYRVRSQGPAVVQIEFAEQVYIDGDGVLRISLPEGPP